MALIRLTGVVLRVLVHVIAVDVRPPSRHLILFERQVHHFDRTQTARRGAILVVVRDVIVGGLHEFRLSPTLRRVGIYTETYYRVQRHGG
ncbi:hypothetical protein D3C73_1014880 [compost metagenome]